jgi:hypothetical protein
MIMEHWTSRLRPDGTTFPPVTPDPPPPPGYVDPIPDLDDALAAVEDPDGSDRDEPRGVAAKPATT